MNPIEQLQDGLRLALPSARLALRVPRRPQGTWWLDATLDNHAVAIEWSARRGFGVTASALGDGYGEGPEEVYPETQDALQRVRALLEGQAYTRPPDKVLLKELRARVGFTQQALASKLGVQQAAVSRLERRDDITLASLRRYVEALGGTLAIQFRAANGEAWSLLEAEPKAVAHAEAQPTATQRPALPPQVLRCGNLERSRTFYSLLGCTLTKEKHDRGPVHYSFTTAGQLVELYPITPKHPRSQVQMNLVVHDLPARLRQLEAENLLTAAGPNRPGRGRPYTLRDPDDNVLVLRDAGAPTGDSCPPAR